MARAPQKPAQFTAGRRHQEQRPLGSALHESTLKSSVLEFSGNLCTWCLNLPGRHPVTPSKLLCPYRCPPCSRAWLGCLHSSPLPSSGLSLATHSRPQADEQQPLKDRSLLVTLYGSNVHSARRTSPAGSSDLLNALRARLYRRRSKGKHSPQTASGLSGLGQAGAGKRCPGRHMAPAGPQAGGTAGLAPQAESRRTLRRISLSVGAVAPEPLPAPAGPVCHKRTHVPESDSTADRKPSQNRVRRLSRLTGQSSGRLRGRLLHVHPDGTLTPPSAAGMWVPSAPQSR